MRLSLYQAWYKEHDPKLQDKVENTYFCGACQVKR